MYANARKMKRTKNEQLKVLENMNANALGHLINQHNQLVGQVVIMQKNQLALINVLKKSRIVDDFVMHQELERIEEMERMKQKAILINPNKAEEPEQGEKEK